MNFSLSPSALSVIIYLLSLSTVSSLLLFCFSDNKCSSTRGQLRASRCLIVLSTFVFLTHSTHALNHLFSPSHNQLVGWFSMCFCHLAVFLTPPGLSSILPLLPHSISCSPPVLSSCQQSPRVKTCWHPLVWQVCVCVCEYVCVR